MKARWLVAVLAVVASAAAVVVYTRARTDASRPVPSTATVSRGDVVETVEATGTLRAVTTVQVGTQVSGTIKALRADFNSEVRRGQIIAELEPSLFQAQVEQARAALVRLQAEARRAEVQSEDAQQKLGRARELSAKALIPASDLETAETTARAAAAAVDAAAAQIVQARASLNQSEVNLGHTIIRSPIDGVVISRNVDVGQTVAASMQAPTLFVLAQDLSAMQVNASVAESDIGRVRPGQRVTFLVDAYPGQVFTGTVSLVRLDPVVEQNVVSYVTTIDVPNPSLVLKPGMTANVTIVV
ncbi:MAG: efflux RND transporter periplasmic adaptor subunit, partial [Vicinamibacterales bacterium]